MYQARTPDADNTGGTVNTLEYRYDEIGNIRNILGNYTKSDGASDSFDHWYTYDSEGRLTRDQGRVENGGIVGGTRITYDAMGRRQTTYALPS